MAFTFLQYFIVLTLLDIKLYSSVTEPTHEIIQFNTTNGSAYKTSFSTINDTITSKNKNQMQPRSNHTHAFVLTEDNDVTTNKYFDTPSFMISTKSQSLDKQTEISVVVNEHPQLGSKYNSLTSNDSKNNASEHSMGNHNGNIVVQNTNSSRITPTVEEMASNLHNSYFPQIISSDNNITVKNSDSVKNLKRMDPNTTSLVLNKTKVEDHIGREFVKAHSNIMVSNNN